MWYNESDIKEMEGKTFTRVYEIDNDTLVFENEQDRYIFYHSQDCCEYVYIESIVGDLDDLVGSPLLLSEEVSSDDSGPISEYESSYTWTFYKFATIKGYVDVRWYGSSNGYYSESVQLRRENV
jgi:hypothetical protein